MKKQRRFSLNVATGVLHTHPASESCNQDQAKYREYFQREKDATKDEGYKRRCWRCFPMKSAAA